MVLKILGGIMVLVSSTFLGFVLSRDCARRPQELRELQRLFQMFENEVLYLSNLLSDAFENIAKSTDNEVGVFFRSALKNLNSWNGITASAVWEKAVKENIKFTALNKEDEQILISFGKMLGNSDMEGQLKNIRLTISQLKMQEQKAEEIRNKSEAMYKRLGFLGGAALVLIFI